MRDQGKKLFEKIPLPFLEAGAAGLWTEIFDKLEKICIISEQPLEFLF